MSRKTSINIGTTPTINKIVPRSDRMICEGSKPLFARDDVKVNAIVDHGSINETTCKTISEISQKDLGTSDKSSRKDVSTTKATTTETNEYRHRGCYGKLPNPKYNSRRPNEVRNASPQKELITSDKSFRRDDSKTKATTTKSNEYRHRGCCGKLPNSRYSSRMLTKVRNASPPTDKGPYYLDKVRERDRLRRLYGSSSRRSLLPMHSGKKSDSRRSTSREKRHRHSPYERGRRQSIDSRRRSRSRSRSYSTDRDYKRRSSRRSRESRSPYPSHKLGSSRSYRTHSPRSERSTHRQSPSTKTNRDITTERKDNLTPVQPTSSYIPVPIPVPDYSFPFVPWPPTAWMHNMQHRPPPGHSHDNWIYAPERPDSSAKDCQLSNSCTNQGRNPGHSPAVTTTTTTRTLWLLSYSHGFID